MANIDIRYSTVNNNKKSATNYCNYYQFHHVMVNIKFQISGKYRTYYDILPEKCVVIEFLENFLFW